MPDVSITTKHGTKVSIDSNGLRAHADHGDDTFGKILAPDRMIWAEFPKHTTAWCWNESVLEWLETLESAYGWPYKIIIRGWRRDAGR